MSFVNVLAVRDQMLALADNMGSTGSRSRPSSRSSTRWGRIACTRRIRPPTRPLRAGERHPRRHQQRADARANYKREAVYLAEFTTRHPTDDNGVPIWHAGAPVSMCHPDETVRFGHHWILPSPLSGMLHFRLKDGPITVARFDGDFGKYRLAVARAGPSTGRAR